MSVRRSEALQVYNADVQGFPEPRSHLTRADPIRFALSERISAEANVTDDRPGQTATSDNSNVHVMRISTLRHLSGHAP